MGRPPVRTPYVHYSETFNINKALHLCETFNVEMFDKDRREGLEQGFKDFKTYVSRSETNGDGETTIRVQYSRKLYGATSAGRMFAHMGVQRLMREFRDTILIDDDGTPMAYDIDIVNCAPTLILQWLHTNVEKDEKYDDIVGPIQRYVDNRDAVISEMIQSMKYVKNRSDAKKLIIEATYGSKKQGPDPTKWLRDYAKAVESCSILVAKCFKYRHIHESKTRSKDPEDNAANSVFSIVIQDMEYECATKAIEFFTEYTDFKPMALVFDGFLLKAQVGVDEISDTYLKDCAAYVKSTTGYAVKFCQKKLEYEIPLPNYNPPYPRPPELGVAKRYLVNDDIDGGDAMADFHSSEIAYDGINFYTKTEGLWSITSTTDLKLWIECRVSEAPMYTLDKDGVETNQPFRFMHKIKSIAQATIGIIRRKHVDKEFPLKLAMSGRGKLLFKNGYVDMAKTPMILRPATDDLLFHTRIDMDYDGEETEYDAEVQRRIFDPIFGDNEEGKATAECWKTYTARGFACELREKRWSILVGNRFCGKGVLSEALKSFGGYYGSFSANNMKTVKGSLACDAELALKFAIDFDKYHFVTSNELNISEVTNSVFDGNMAKMLASGGDDVSIRSLYNMPRTIVPIARMMLCANDIPPIEPADAKSTLLIFKLNGIFATEKEMSDDPNVKRCMEDGDATRYMLADPKIKEFCNEPGFKMAFIRIILKAYKDTSDYISEKVAQDSSDNKKDDDVSELFQQCFIYTGNDQESVKRAVVKSLLKNNFSKTLTFEQASQALGKMNSRYGQGGAGTKEERAVGFRKVQIKSDSEIAALFE